MIVNKSELINVIAKKADIKKTTVEQTLNTFMSVVTHTLANNDSVVLAGFGNFSVKKRAKRKGRHPQTGEPITIAASKIPGFKAGKSFKNAVR